MSDITTKKEALAAISKTKVADQEPDKPDTDTPAAQPTDAPPTSLQDFRLPELTHEFNAEPPTRKGRRLPIQIMVVSCGILMVLGFVQMLQGRGNTPAPAANQNQTPDIGMSEDDKDAIIADLQLKNSQLEQKFSTGDLTSLEGQLKKPGTAKSATSPKPSAASTPKPPSAAHRVSRPISVRRSVPHPKPRIVYRDRPVPKAQPVVATSPKPAAQPQPQPQPAPKPAAEFTLSNKSAHAPQPLEPQPKSNPPIKISSSRPLNRSLVDRKPTAVRRKPTAVKTPPQGILVASLTGDLLQDNQVATDSREGIYPTPESSPGASLGTGQIAPGTTAKAKLDNPITWIPQNSGAVVGQRYLLTLSEDLGAMAKKGSKVVAEVTSAEGDFVSMQVVEVNQQPIEHMDLADDSPEARKTPVAVIQYKDTPYLQAKLKGQGEGFGNKLLRAGLNAGIDQLRSSSVGDHASSVVSSLAPSRSSSGSRNGVYHFDKEVEIYFMEGV